MLSRYIYSNMVFRFSVQQYVVLTLTPTYTSVPQSSSFYKDSDFLKAKLAINSMCYGVHICCCQDFSSGLQLWCMACTASVPRKVQGSSNRIPKACHKRDTTCAHKKSNMQHRRWALHAEGPQHHRQPAPPATQLPCYRRQPDASSRRNVINANDDWPAGTQHGPGTQERSNKRPRQGKGQRAMAAVPVADSADSRTLRSSRLRRGPLF
jgi:hypothetical protein